MLSFATHFLASLGRLTEKTLPSCLVALAIASFFLLQTAPAHANPLYAGIVVETNREVILYEKNANALRHPASLTKAMSIYLAFEALKSGKWNWNTRLTASARAAAQPQTNINLKAGDTIRVRDALEAMIVRSANDVSVVVAEAIGGTEARFARMMTEKARQLGMKDTVYKNANGLPDEDQVTTARDQVRLALALQKHFPDYYPIFQTAEFEYKGQQYHSHNRVMRYYPGATGLKTGFIRASGFNLITTVSRDGYDLIGVVMGGQSSKSRDNHMVTLMDTALAELKNSNVNVASRSRRNKGFDNFVPVPEDKPQGFETALADNTEADGGNQTGIEERFASAGQGGEDIVPVPTYKPAPAQQLAYGDRPSPVEAHQQVSLSMNDAQSHAAVYTPQDVKDWAIQVGTFSTPTDAKTAAANALTLIQESIPGAAVRVANVGKGQRTLHRAHLANLSETQARQACSRLMSMQESCFVFKTVQTGDL